MWCVFFCYIDFSFSAHLDFYLPTFLDSPISCTLPILSSCFKPLIVVVVVAAVVVGNGGSSSGSSRSSSSSGSRYHCCSS